MARDLGFGRLEAPKDGRDFDYLTRAMLPQMKAALAPKPRKTAYHEGPLLNQGQTPRCVGFSHKGFLNAAPIMSKPAAEPSAATIYTEAQKRDEWAGENYDGTSARGACKYLLEAGEIESYAWATSADEIAEWTNGGNGTVLFGADWYPIFDDVPKNGIIPIPASMATPIGGHEFRFNWFDPKVGAFLMINTWGNDWGIEIKGTLNGRAYFTKDLVNFLLRGGADCACPVQVKLKPVKI